MPALNATGRSAPDAADLPTFLGKPRFASVTGPLRLYRFGSDTGRWWYGQSLIDELKADFLEENYGGERSKPGHGNIVTPLRDGLAVSHEWNRFDWFCSLTLPANAALECWMGETFPQPAWQAKPDGQVLRGGMIQYLIYDMAKIPPGLVMRQPTAQVWLQWSRNLGRFGSSTNL